VNDETVIGKAGKFNVCFRELTLASHAGIVLLKEMVDQFGIPALIDRELGVKVRERGYGEADSVMALCWNLILGGEHLSDLNVLRGDAGTQQLLGLASVLAPTTAGEFLRKFTIGDIYDLQRLLRRASAAVRPWQTSNVCTFDLDSSLYEQDSKEKEGVRRAYTGAVGYNPLFCFWAEEGELLHSDLRAGNRHSAYQVLPFFQKVLACAPEVKTYQMRGDSAYYCWDLIDELDARGILYAITADLTAPLQQAIQALPEKAWQRYSRQAGAAVAELRYAPHPHAAHRYVVKRVLRYDKEKQPYYCYHAVITNDLRRTPRPLMEWALKRCNLENLIKEHKSAGGFGLEKFPTHKYFANWAWLLMGQLAFNLVAWFKRLVLPKQYHRATIKTIRYHVLNVAGRITQSGRQFFLLLSDHNSYQDVWRFALNQLDKFAT
jgi:Transposase DDE domain group 1